MLIKAHLLIITCKIGEALLDRMYVVNERTQSLHNSPSFNQPD